MRTQWTNATKYTMYHMECPVNPHFSGDMEHLVPQIPGKDDCEFTQILADSNGKVCHISLTDLGKGEQKWVGVWGDDMQCVMNSLIAVCKGADQLMGDAMVVPSVFLPTLAISYEKGYEHSGYANWDQVWTWEKRAMAWSERGVVRLCK
jgi:hypothetical protein